MQITTIKKTFESYPRQFWLMLAGMLISSAGASMIWPFLYIYISERLALPLAVIASLASLNAVVGLAASLIGGPITDRLGRKWIMVFSLIVNGVVYVFLSRADSFAAFALLLSLSGAFNPLYRIGGDAMLADLISPEKRPDAYALARLSNNLGIAIGPAVGGFITTHSYATAFYMAAIGLGSYGLLMAFFAAETMPKRAAAGGDGSPATTAPGERFAGYGRIWRDQSFLSFVGAFTLTQMCSTLMWLMMGVYAKTNFGVPEYQYGWVATTNAAMVVTLQMLVTTFTRRFPPLWLLGTGTLLYALANGSVALASGFWGFWISMVIMTCGELILMPTASTHVANLAPADMRGRYMSLFGLSWPVAAGIAPVMGGILSDRFGPPTIWYGGLSIGLVATLVFVVLAKAKDRQTAG